PLPTPERYSAPRHPTAPGAQGLRIYVPFRFLNPRIGAGLGKAHCFLDLGRGLGIDDIELFAREDPVCHKELTQSLDGAALLTLFDLLPGAVHIRIAFGMPHVTVRVEDEKHGSVIPHVFTGLPRGTIDANRIVAVH